jgi:hypothetical protein
MSNIRIIKREAVPRCGSYEVRIDGRPSRYFYFDDIAGTVCRRGLLTGEQALEEAKAFARSEHDR